MLEDALLLVEAKRESERASERESEIDRRQDARGSSGAASLLARSRPLEVAGENFSVGYF